MARLLNVQEIMHLKRPVVLLPLEEYALLLERASYNARAPKSPAKAFPAISSRKLLKLLNHIRREKGPVFNSTRKFRRYLSSL